MKRIISLIGIGIFSAISSTFVPTNSFAAENNVYDFSWLDKEKEVYVLQNRKFRKKGAFYVGGTYGLSVNGAYIDSTEVNLMAGFFFSEDWGLEFSYKTAEGEENKTYEGITAQNAVAFFRQIETATTAMIVWSPFYSKINTFNKIFYYDWMFGLGLANVSTTDNRKEFTAGSDSNQLTEEDLSGVAWMTALRFYITEDWSTRIDFRGMHVNADSAISGETDTEKRWNNYYTFNFGINYAF